MHSRQTLHDGHRRSVSRRRTSAPTAFIALLLAGSCTVPRPTVVEEPRQALPALTARGILGPVDGDGAAELARLRRLPDAHPVRLRRANIWLSNGGHNRALTELNRVIFGEPKPSPAAESFARYLRSIAYDKKGDRDRSAFDREKAATLAQDSELRRLIEARTPAPVPSEATPSLRLLARSAWNAAPSNSRRMVRMTPVQRITVHHSAMYADSGGPSDSGAVVRSIQKNHIQGKGWGDIGYHYLIDRDGRVWTGRPEAWQGAHAGDPASNRGNVGVCLLGNFVSRGQSPSSRQLQALELLVADLCRRHRVPPDRILTHREIRATECPGARLQAAVEQMRRSMLLGATASTRRSKGNPAEE